ncbi:tRNA (adenosine(37)-N6)-dimethylallyltransferase MiaA [Sporosarcina sp. Marseille-Q4063]|nr:tRNA (adenosine(37)-N6)-dimethylallyltransferase MiaA [Sporosarcina sp. Marseille-Q4063]
MTENLDVLAIVGPTASGKTALSVTLAKLLGAEIINGDSMQVYKGLDIGTAKITTAEMDGVPHHLFDIIDADETFSVAQYQAEVRKKIEEIQARGKLPIIVGGTGLYVQSVLYDFRFTDEASDMEVRNRLEKELDEIGAEHLYQRLEQLDPIDAKKIHPNNHRRIIRALEIIEVTGKTKGEHEQNAGKNALYNHLLIGLELERDLLYDRIDRRVDLMMEQGFLQEAENLWNAGIRNMQSVQAIGYKELHQYIEGKIPLDVAIQLIKKNSRNYAKRQMTYFRNKLAIDWVDATKGTDEQVKEIFNVLKGFRLGKENVVVEKSYDHTGGAIL